jgi:GTPase SAR1 family protein
MPSNKKRSLFFGREKELARLSRFLSDTSGGAILVAGDRGAGKTSLVSEAIKRRTREHQGWRRYTFSKTVVVNVPLIITGEGIADKSNYYRSLIMRTIVRALESDLLERKNSKVDLPQRWFRSIGYMQNLRRLKPYTKFISLNQKVAQNIALGFSEQSGGAKAGIQRALSGEVDISDASLEIKLRNLLREYSKIHSFIIVLDELDKLPYDKNPIGLELIAIFLKNLFTETNIHVIFISDEPPLGRITATIARDPFSAEKTLFKALMLLNELMPNDYAEFFKTKFAPHINPDDQEQVKYALASYTNKSPSELNKFLLENGTSNTAEVLKESMGEYEYLFNGAMQVFIDEVYTKMSSKYDAYFSRTLYKALTIAGEIILQLDVDYINWNDFNTLFWTTDKFADKTEEADLKRARYTSISELKTLSNDQIPEIVLRLTELSSDKRRHISNALGYLLYLLDKRGFISLERATDRVELIRLTDFHEDNFNVGNIALPLEDAIKPNEREEGIFHKVVAQTGPYKAILGSELSETVNPSPILRHNNELEISDFPTAIFSCFWTELESFANQAPKLISEKVLEKLLPVFDASWTKEIKDNGVVVISKNVTEIVRYQLVFNVGGIVGVDFGDKKKTFVFNSPGIKRLTKGSNPKIKNYDMQAEWGNWEEVFSEVLGWFTADIAK